MMRDPRTLEELMERAAGGGLSSLDGLDLSALDSLAETEPQPDDPLSGLVGQEPHHVSAPVHALADTPINQAASVVQGSNGVAYGGPDTRPDLLARAGRVRDLYKPEPASASDRFEREWLGQNARPTEDDFMKGWVMRLFSPEASGEYLNMLTQRQQRFDAGLAAARAADEDYATRSRRVDPATAQMLVMAGVDPEFAVTTRLGDPALKLAMQGGLGLGSKFRGQDTTFNIHNIGETGKTLRDAQAQDAQGQRAELASDTQKAVAEIQKRGKGGAGGGGGLDPRLLSTYLQQTREGVTKEVADAYSTGALDLSTVSPEIAQKLENGKVAFQSLDHKKRNEVVAAMERGIANQVGRFGTWQRQEEFRDRDKRMEFRNNLTNLHTDLGRAAAGLKLLQRDPNALRAYMSLGPGDKSADALFGMAQARKIAFSPKQQIAISAIQTVINNITKERSGASVTGGEWNRLAQEIGLPQGVDPWNSDAALTSWLQMMRRKLNLNASEYNRAFGEDPLNWVVQ